MEKEIEKTLNPIGSGNPDISIIDAIIVQLRQDLEEIGKELGIQRSESKNIINGVLIALVVIVVTVALQVIFANRIDNKQYNSFYKDLNDQRIELNNIKNNFENLKIRNYLK